MMQPEAVIQRDSVDWLNQQGWTCLRLGFDGLPDILATRLNCLLPKADIKRGYPVKFYRGHPLYRQYPKGFTIPRGSHGNIIALEFKTPIGRLNGRQQAILHILEQYCTVGVPRSVEDVISIVNLLL